MSEHHHDNHEHDHAKGEPLVAEQLDPANRALAEALRVSFRVLSFIMAMVVIAYLLSGMFQVGSTERAVILRFGKISDHGVLGPGFHFSWPSPIDQVRRVSTAQQELTIDSFWFRERPAARTMTLDELSLSAPKKLRPGLDGALMTGDQGLIHITWKVLYQVPANDDQAVIDYLSNVDDVGELVQWAVENASIRAAAHWPVESILQGADQFTRDVRDYAQEMLDEVRAGVKITLSRDRITPPLRTRSYFNAVTAAVEEKKAAEVSAQGKRFTILVDTTGSENLDAVIDAVARYDEARTARANSLDDAGKLLGQILAELPADVVASVRAVTGDPIDPERITDALVADLRSKYESLNPKMQTRFEELQAALADAEQSDALGQGQYDRLGELLESDQTTGQVRAALDDARGYATTVVQKAEEMQVKFLSLLEAFKQNPSFTVASEWNRTLKGILESERVEIFIVPDDLHWVIQANRNPETVEQQRSLEVQDRLRRIQAQQEANK